MDLLGNPDASADDTEKQVRFQEDLREVLEDFEVFLHGKNRKYGDAALEPIGCFSKLPSSEGIRNRLDDKLSRMMAAEPDDEEDVLKDITGYLLILQVALKREARAAHASDSA